MLATRSSDAPTPPRSVALAIHALLECAIPPPAIARTLPSPIAPCNCPTIIFLCFCFPPPSPRCVSLTFYVRCNTPPVVDCSGKGDKCHPYKCATNNGSCVPDAPVVCDDGSACTIDTCVLSTGILALSYLIPTSISAYLFVGGCSFAPISCDDKDPCTDDTCDKVKGCVHIPKVCNDNSVCTNDTCVGGSMSPSLPLLFFSPSSCVFAHLVLSLCLHQVPMRRQTRVHCWYLRCQEWLQLHPRSVWWPQCMHPGHVQYC